MDIFVFIIYEDPGVFNIISKYKFADV